MLPLLKPFHYTNSEWFSQEQTRIFGRLWMLAAIKPMLANHRDYRTLMLAGKSVVLQNHNGVIRAFSNICRHRMARIQNEEFGNRALVCNYHHWCYGEKGELIHTHKDPAVFGFSAEEVKGIGLRQYAVATIGKLIFVNLSDNPIPLNHQFDDETIDSLERYTNEMDESFIYTKYEANFNWKTGMENIKDSLHPFCLHKSTFPEHFQQTVPVHKELAGLKSSYPTRPLALYEGTARGALPINNPPVLPWEKLVHRLDCRGRYQLFHLFPNVNFMIIDGRSFGIQIYNPLSANTTEMQMMAALTKSVDDFGYKPVVLWEHLLSDMKVFQEDLDCLEPLQVALSSGESEDGFIHGSYETLILDFQAAYISQMKELSLSRGIS